MITITSASTLSAVSEYQPTVAFQSHADSSASSSASASGSDTVQLSPTAQATAMQQEGLSVTEISSSMGLTTAEVDSYLGITNSSSSAPAALSGGGAIHAAAPRHSGTGSEVTTAPSSSTPQASASKQTKT